MVLFEAADPSTGPNKETLQQNKGQHNHKVDSNKKNST